MPRNELMHVGRRVLVELLIVAKDEDGHIDGTQDGELVCLFKQAALSLEKRSAREEISQLWRDDWGIRRKRSRDKTYTERFRSSLMALISIFLRPIFALFAPRDGRGPGEDWRSRDQDARARLGTRIRRASKKLVGCRSASELVASAPSRTWPVRTWSAALAVVCGVVSIDRRSWP